MDDHLVRVFCGEIVTQCRFVQIAAAQLEESLAADERGAEQAHQASVEAQDDLGERLREMYAPDADDLTAVPEIIEVMKEHHERIREQRGEPHAVFIARTWLALQSILVAAANISKLLWGSGGKGREERKAARAPLRAVLNVDKSSPLFYRSVRNGFEHFDKELDCWFEPSGGHAYVGRNIVASPQGSGVEDEGHFGLYNPVTGTVSFWTHSVRLPEIIAEVERILPLAESRSA